MASSSIPRLTISNLRNLVRWGYAQDVTTGPIPCRRFNVIALSYGLYGVNGALIHGDNGRLMCIIARSSNLFRCI